MIILSQDGHPLVDARFVDYNYSSENDNDGHVVTEWHKIIDENINVLGQYSTKEKCLEIIDAIAERQENGDYWYRTFKMPKE